MSKYNNTLQLGFTSSHTQYIFTLLNSDFTKFHAATSMLRLFVIILVGSSANSSMREWRRGAARKFDSILAFKPFENIYMFIDFIIHCPRIVDFCVETQI
jgi:hypothetical protein